EQFVPQMTNMDLIDGVSFQKGCYPGQEIVARMQYLGKLKRRMYLVNIAADAVCPGDELFSADLEGQASGMIVNAAPSPNGGFDALAVIQIESARDHEVRFKSLDGPKVHLNQLPYEGVDKA
ncbi:MAG TPA: folate-binding protein, partial [Burkholderiales bacterium]|nr:folate-binding protein [Burkholderiales bacterium]